MSRIGSIAELPSRVRKAIREVEEQNEILISWIQTGFVTLLAGLYFASPKAFRADVPFEPVPIVLAVYAPAVLVRLFLAHGRRLTPALLSASIVLDVGAILTLIWSFHIQYDQPPGFYLKAPTFAYVFLFVALRSLRYDLRYVALTGAAAIVGWSILLLYAIRVGGAEITRDYVGYVLGTHVLVGAEIDKMVSVLLVTAVLAIGVERSRRLLATAASEAQASRELSRFFGRDVAERIRLADEEIRPGEGEVRRAASLMMDIRGFTRFAEAAGPSAVMALLASYQRRMVAVIGAHGGTIDKFLGDGIFAHFGAARPSATYAADALRAAEALSAAADAWLEEGVHDGFEFGISVAAGEVIFGAVGDDERLEYTVIGDPVNLSAKLEKHTKKLGVRALTTRAAFDLARDQGHEPGADLRLLVDESVDGVARPIDLVVLAERRRWKRVA